jgi:hypothetical protein
LSEALAYCPFDTVSTNRPGDRFFGHCDAEPGNIFSPHSIDIETGIRDPEPLTKASGKFRREMQPGLGWKPGTGLA